MVLLIPRVSFDYEEVGLKEEMLQRDDKRDWKSYCCYQIFERVSHVTFKEKKHNARGGNSWELFCKSEQGRLF